MKIKTDICYIVSHGFAARMVLQTGLLEKMVHQGKKVALITPDGSDKNLQEYCSRQGFDIYEFKEPKDVFSTNYMFMRKYFLEDIRNNPGLWARHLRALSDTRFKWGFRSVFGWMMPRFYYLVYQLIKVFPYFRNWFRKYEGRILHSDKADMLLKVINPELVIATYPVNLPEAMLLRAASRNKVATVIHLLSWDNITCKGHFPSLADYYIAWGPVMKQEFQEYYNIQKNKIFACGVPHFDAHIAVKNNPDYKRYLVEMGLNPDYPYLFMAMSAPLIAPNGIDIVEWLAKEVTAGRFGDNMQLIVRPHPQNVQTGMADRSWLPRLDNIRNSRVGVDYPGLVESNLPWSMQHHDMLRLSNLIIGCSVCLNFGSTVSLDALMVDRPVIVISFDGEKDLPWYLSGRRQMDFIHYKKLIELGGVQVVKSFEDMTNKLKIYIANPELDADLRRYTLLEECGYNDGLSTERVVKSLFDIQKFVHDISPAETNLAYKN